MRSDLIVATGRSDLQNQVNNSICFPYLFRAALDLRVKKFSMRMFFAAIHAIAELAKETPSADVLREIDKSADEVRFGPNCILRIRWIRPVAGSGWCRRLCGR